MMIETRKQPMVLVRLKRDDIGLTSPRHNLRVVYGSILIGKCMLEVLEILMKTDAE